MTRSPTVMEKTVVAPAGARPQPASPTPPQPASRWPVVLFSGLALLLTGLVAALVMVDVLTGGSQTEFSEATLEKELVPVEPDVIALGPEDLPPEPPEVTQPGIIELSGNPIVIPRRRTVERQLLKVPDVEPRLAKSLKLQGEVYRMAASLSLQGENVTQSLPGSQESFAFFQGVSDANAGEFLSDDTSGSSTVTALDDSDQAGSREDMIIEAAADTTLAKILVEQGFDEKSAAEIESAAAGAIAVPAILKGDVVAIRGDRGPEAGFVPVQVSIYRQARALGTVALTDRGIYAPGEDPWFDQNIFETHSGQVTAAAKYRLLDAIYQAAVRNNVPTAVTGETIQLLSRAHDLEQPAAEGDGLVVVFSSKPRDRKSGFGRVLYVRIERTDGPIECYAFQPAPGAQFECVSGDGLGTAVDGMVTPVKGVIARRFGPYREPGSKKAKMNYGVDWTAREGAAVLAAFPGTVQFAGTTPEWGITVKIVHKDKSVTLYGNLRDYGRLSEGEEVRAGQRIGAVGLAPDGKEARLHFELHRGGAPVDPFGTYQAQIERGGAIETLVHRITTVESANRCDARNPLSTAVGLGQFIESTWLRIIRDHRPDLMQGRSRAEILALRLDCTLARQMTTALTRENSNYIRSQGHAATAGNLYLAHFLGPGGAVKALSSPPDAPIINAFGAGVVNANPFLRGQTTGWLIQWAARKMNFKGKATATASVAPAPAPATPQRYAANPQFAQLKEAVEVMLR